jgi:hypothetical protein
MLAAEVAAAATFVSLDMPVRKSVAEAVMMVTGKGTSRPAKPVMFLWEPSLGPMQFRGSW